jgi:hypothetical protein
MHEMLRPLAAYFFICHAVPRILRGEQTSGTESGIGQDIPFKEVGVMMKYFASPPSQARDHDIKWVIGTDYPKGPFVTASSTDAQGATTTQLAGKELQAALYKLSGPESTQGVGSSVSSGFGATVKGLGAAAAAGMGAVGL